MRKVILALLLTVMCVSYKAQAGRGRNQLEESGPTESKVLAVHYPRPLAEAAKFLGLYLGVAVSYEDPAWSFSPDIERNEDSPNRSPGTKPDVVGPVWGRLEMQFPISSRTLRPTDPPQALLERLLAEHLHQKNAGSFRIAHVGDGFDIIPVGCSNRESKLAPCGSPLDTMISFPEEEREARATLALILEKVKDATGERISVSEMNTYVLQGGKVKLGAKNDAARDVIAGTLREIQYPDGSLPVKTAWGLYYDPQGRSFVLNLRTVTALTPQAGGGAVPEPVFVTRP
jgi:hypothetical protein